MSDQTTNYDLETLISWVKCKEPFSSSDGILRYIQLAYANHDIAHNIEHVHKVTLNAMNIEALLMKSFVKEPFVKEPFTKLTTTEHNIFNWVMMMHDSRDHKLASKGICRSEEEITAIATELFGAEIAVLINHIHNNCSYSKRKESLPVPENKHGVTDTLRKILQDADWIEAIGEVGINRCREYHTMLELASQGHYSTAQIDADIYTHIHEKLLHIKENVNFEATRRLIEEQDLEAPLHAFIKYYESTY